MRKAILTDKTGDASTVWVDGKAEAGDKGEYALVDSSEVDYTSVEGEIIQIEDDELSIAAATLA